MLHRVTRRQRSGGKRQHTRGKKEAHYRVGLQYECGDGVAKDSAQAARWYQKAAEQDHPRAQFKFGTYVDMGVAEAQLVLGFKYYGGRDIKQNPFETARPWKLSAEQGFEVAHFFWGQLLESGRCGVSKNKKEAIKWLKKAAEQGNTDAQSKLRSLGVKF